MRDLSPLEAFLPQVESTAEYLRSLRGQHAQFAEIWAKHLEGDAKTLKLLAAVLEDEIVAALVTTLIEP